MLLSLVHRLARKKYHQMLHTEPASPRSKNRREINSRKENHRPLVLSETQTFLAQGLPMELKNVSKRSFTMIRLIPSDRCRDGMTYAHQGIRHHMTHGKMLHHTSPQDLPTHRP